MLHLAVEWGRVERIPARISLLPGERQRDRVLSIEEETAYLNAASEIGAGSLADYENALGGIRAKKRGQQPIKPADAFLLRDVATVLLDCGLRPEECHRLRWRNVRDGNLTVPFGKTENATRIIPMAKRAAGVLEMRRTIAPCEWVFPAPTRSGHINQSSIKKQHAKACKLADVPFFVPYVFRHTCLTRWAAYMDPYTLAYLAGHSDFGTTKRYVHQEMETVRAAMEKAQGGHRIGHSVNPTALGDSSKVAVIN